MDPFRGLAGSAGASPFHGFEFRNDLCYGLPSIPIALRSGVLEILMIPS